ncbi:MAG: hypothetical protein CSB55_03350 [Candidatus Cloacimonadota bacterium]|nr:MAG: hypothetical protein CSB55_03350 [Candidatus Cloacimonadota bacterium]
MFKILVQQEITALLKSKRVLWSVSIFFILYLVIFSVRVKDFNERNRIYIEDVKTAEDLKASAKNYSYTAIPVIRKPMLYSVFNEGFTHERGSYIWAPPLHIITSSEYKNSSENGIYDFPNRMDITFLITFFMGLFVFLISFDSVNYEKEKHLLRLLFSYPVKRTDYIFKKIIGIISLVLLVFTLPFLFGNFYLMLTNSAALTADFFSFTLIYWFFTVMYLFSITLIGVYVSVICRKPSTSLITVLLIWVTLTAIIPTIYDFIGKETLNKKEKQESLSESISQDQIYVSTHMKDVPDESNPNKVGHWNWNGGTYVTIGVFGEKKMYRHHINYMKWVYKNLYPILQRIESNLDEYHRLRHRFEKLKPDILFFSPVAQFESAAEIISMTGADRYAEYLNDARTLRSLWTETGVKYNWLFSKNYFCVVDTSACIISIEEYLLDEARRDKVLKVLGISKFASNQEEKILKKMADLTSSSKLSPELEKMINVWQDLNYKRMNEAYKNKPKFEYPQTPVYKQRYFRISDVLLPILLRFLVGAVFSAGLLVAVIAKFKNYDIR